MADKNLPQSARQLVLEGEGLAIGGAVLRLGKDVGIRLPGIAV